MFFPRFITEYCLNITLLKHKSYHLILPQVVPEIKDMANEIFKAIYKVLY